MVAPAIIAGGLSILGGLLGNNSKRQAQKATNKQNEKITLRARKWALQDNALQYERLRKAAIRGGFNPLTVLRAGGSGTPASTGMIASEPVMASGEALAGAVSEGVQTWFNVQSDQRDAQKDALERELLKAELDQINKQTATVRDMSFGYGIPKADTYGVRSDANIAPSLARSVSTGGADGVTVGGVTVKESPNFSPAQKFEDRYGDVASSVYGIGVIGADAINTLRNYADDKGWAWRGVRFGGADAPALGPFKTGPKVPKPYRRFDPNKADGYYTAPWQ